MKDQIFAYVKDKYGTVPEYPWKKYTGNAVLRHEDNNKWYGLIMPVDKELFKNNYSFWLVFILIYCVVVNQRTTWYASFLRLVYEHEFVARIEHLFIHSS